MLANKIVGNRQANSFGDQLRNSQERATQEGFDKVNKSWFDRCIKYDDMRQVLEESAEKTNDLRLNLGQIEPTIRDEVIGCKIVGGKFDGKFCELSDNSMGQFTKLIGLTPSVLKIGQTVEEQQLVGQLVKSRLNSVVKSKDKELFLRIRENGSTSIRAFLTNKYAVIDHRWVFDTVSKNIPGGIVSHFDKDRFYETGGDYFRYNVLIPDSIREENDSEYGGGYNVSNDEVGRGRFGFLPFLFRHICWNGNVWDRTNGEKFSQVHKGVIDFRMLAKEIHVHLNSQIPLVYEGIQRFMVLQTMESPVKILRLVCNLINDRRFMLSQKVIGSIISGYMDEPLGDNAFGLINAITRASQKQDLYLQDSMEIMAGTLTSEWVDKPQNWDVFCKQAENITDEMVKKIIVGMAA